MSSIDRVSTFRGKVADHAVSLTKNEFPQLVCQLVATEIYDEEDQVWVDWADVEQNEIVAYIVLYGGKGETLSFNQVKKVFKWDGASFQVLNDGDYSEIGIQFRVVESTYKEKTTLKVEWIDEYDAVPGRSVRKLDRDELKQLDAKYAQLLKAGGTKIAPAKAVKAAGIKPTSPKGPVKKNSTPSMPKTSTDTASPEMPAGHCTKNEAWDWVVEMRDKKIDDKKLAESWTGAIQKIGDGKPVEKFTDEQWFLIKEQVLSETAVF